MRIVCPACSAQYEIPDQAIPASGTDVCCAACKGVWFVAAAPVQETTAPPAVEPLPPEEPVAEFEPVIEDAPVVQDDPVIEAPAEDPRPTENIAEPEDLPEQPTLAEAEPEPEPEPAPEPERHTAPEPEPVPEPIPDEVIEDVVVQPEPERHTAAEATTFAATMAATAASTATVTPPLAQVSPERIAPPPPKSGRGVTIAWIVSILLLVCAIAAFVMFRDDIISAWPASARLYAWLGQ